MTMNCKNCQASPEVVTEVPFWTEYRVGDIESDERFYLCPTCKQDDAIDPIQLWADAAVVYEMEKTTAP